MTGKHIGIAVGSRYSGPLERIRSRMFLFEDMMHLTRLRMLIAGRLDGAVFSGDVAAVRFLAEQQGLDISGITYSEMPISRDANHIGVPKSLTGFEPAKVVEKLNAALAEMKSAGMIEKILNRYR